VKVGVTLGLSAVRQFALKLTYCTDFKYYAADVGKNWKIRFLAFSDSN
jgi:hypothetical protein